MQAAVYVLYSRHVRDFALALTTETKARSFRDDSAFFFARIITSPTSRSTILARHAREDKNILRKYRMRIDIVILYELSNQTRGRIKDQIFSFLNKKKSLINICLTGIFLNN